jgi:hypothetical protein
MAVSDRAKRSAEDSALLTGVVPEALRATMVKKRQPNILVKNEGHLDTGMLGTYFMMETLRELGRHDRVFTMFNQTTYPGWGHMLAEGTTTFWEQWNGHWPRVHSCFTSPDHWLYPLHYSRLRDSWGVGRLGHFERPRASLGVI